MIAGPNRARDRFRLPRWGQRGTAGASIPAQLAFEGISQAYGSLRAVDGVTLAIEPGARLPPRSFGLRQDHAAQAGGRRDAERRARADGRLRSERPASFVPPERRGIGLMFQDYALFPHLTILANVMFGLRTFRPGG